MQHVNRWTLGGVLLMLCAWSLQAQAQYRITLFKAPANTIGHPEVTAVNSAGEGTGYATLTSNHVDRGFDWSTPSSPTILKQLTSGAFVRPFGINNVGGICGESDSTTAGRGVLWDNGTPVELPPLAGAGSNDHFSTCYALNDRGQMVGYSTSTSGRETATLWTRFAIIDRVVLTTTNLGALGAPGANFSEAWAISPSGQVIVGDSAVDDFTGNAVVWRNRVLTDLGRLGGRYSTAKGVNDQGQAVGWTDTPTPGARVPFVWQNGTMTPLPVVMDGMENAALSINSAGVIVGQIDAPTTQTEIFTHAAMWQNGTLIDLDTVLHALVPVGTVVTTASSMTDSGRYLVSVDSNASSAFYLVTPVNPTQVTLTSSANPSYLGSNVTFTAHVTSAGHGTPTGTVTFTDGSTTLGKVALSFAGAATFTTGSLTIGTHSIVAHYAANDVYGASNSPALAQHVIFKLIPIPR